MDDTQKVEKVDDNTVKVSTTTSEDIDVSVLKQNLADATQGLADFEAWVIEERAGRQQGIDDAQAVLDQVVAVGVAVDIVASSDEEIS